MPTAWDLFIKLRQQPSKKLSKDLVQELCLQALTTTYDRIGPRQSTNGKVSLVPPKTFALLSSFEVDQKWDFDDRHLAHEVACVLAVAAMVTSKRR